jgi:hypothetical protein
VIKVSHDLPHAELPDPDLDGRDRPTSSGPGASAAAEQDRTGPGSPGWDALVAVAKLLARQAAEEDFRPQEG